MGAPYTLDREARWLHGSSRRLLGCSAGAIPDIVAGLRCWPQQGRGRSWTSTASKALQVGMAQGRWASADQALWFGLAATVALAGGGPVPQAAQMGANVLNASTC
jgi:hypothetical protein